MFMKDISYITESDSEVTAATGTAQLQMAGRLCGTSSRQSDPGQQPRVAHRVREQIPELRVLDCAENGGTELGMGHGVLHHHGPEAQDLEAIWRQSNTSCRSIIKLCISRNKTPFQTWRLCSCAITADSCGSFR